jgi:hypothetical protein
VAKPKALSSHGGFTLALICISVTTSLRRPEDQHFRFGGHKSRNSEAWFRVLKLSPSNEV